MISKIKTSLQEKSSKKRKITNEWFFKTKKGDYAEHDQFIGVNMPDIRKIANEYKDINKNLITKLLYSKIHEERLLSLIILVNKYRKHKKYKKQIYDFYIKNVNQVNNWDLVDVSCYNILGDYIYEQKKDPIKKLKTFCDSNSMWKRRISIVSTLYFIKKGIYNPTIQISKKLLSDKEDLIHKAVGWMLREVWKNDNKLIENFIIKHYEKIPIYKMIVY
jgi:3-methyladenine DNA glycosylase AlkD